MRTLTSILTISVLMLFQANEGSALNFKDFVEIKKEAEDVDHISPEISEAYIQEINEMHTTTNPDVDPETDVVIVLSARSSPLGQNVDQLPRDETDHDSFDDINRMKLGVEIAKKVAALKSQKTHLTPEDYTTYGPLIIYNGRPLHNQDLRKILNEKGEHIGYPAQKFFILDLNPEEYHTLGQMVSLKRDGTLLLKGAKSISIVTHAYHGPRTLRLVGGKYNPFSGNPKLSLHLVDRDLKSPGVRMDMISEMVKIQDYIHKGDILRYIPNSITYNNAKI